MFAWFAGADEETRSKSLGGRSQDVIYVNLQTHRIAQSLISLASYPLTELTLEEKLEFSTHVVVRGSFAVNAM